MIPLIRRLPGRAYAPGMERLTVDQVEEDWERALDSAFEAVKFCATSGLVTPAYARRELVVIEEERQWLTRITPALGRLFPARRFRR